MCDLACTGEYDYLSPISITLNIISIVSYLRELLAEPQGIVLTAAQVATSTPTSLYEWIIRIYRRHNFASC